MDLGYRLHQCFSGCGLWKINKESGLPRIMMVVSPLLTIDHIEQWRCDVARQTVKYSTYIYLSDCKAKKIGRWPIAITVNPEGYGVLSCLPYWAPKSIVIFDRTTPCRFERRKKIFRLYLSTARLHFNEMGTLLILASDTLEKKEMEPFSRFDSWRVKRNLEYEFSR